MSKEKAADAIVDAQKHQISQLPEVLTPDHVAKFLGVNIKTVYEACDSGELPHRRIGKAVGKGKDAKAKLIRIHRDALLDWISCK